ncbi:hypothetical protein RB195_014891 [Necator americanus]|uniref:Uncharacterized protein n=1 Tax=Necator americanus TaxID=51031 RepID=A0ABR1E231_NECAM
MGRSHNERIGDRWSERTFEWILRDNAIEKTRNDKYDVCCTDGAAAWLAGYGLMSLSNIEDSLEDDWEGKERLEKMLRPSDLPSERRPCV